MTNISRNIKKLRTERKLTQEQLAEKISVTRQTISSWETNRTQPDIDMLSSLSEALETDIEELIYGKKKNVGLEPDKTRNRKTLSTVLIIMGSLLSAVGVIFLFVYFWQEIPGAAKTVMAFLPLTAGAAFALFTLTKKKDSLAFKESAAVIWCAGVFATNALVNSIFKADFGFENLLFADVLLVLPAVFLLDSVFLFTVESVISSAAIFFEEIYDKNYMVVGFFTVFAVCAVFVFINKQEKPIKKYCAWIALLGAGAHGVFISRALDDDLQPAVIIVFSFFLAMFIAEKSRLFELRLKEPALALLCAVLLVLSLLTRIDDGIIENTEPVAVIFALIWSLICVIPAFITGRGTFAHNAVKLLFTSLFLLFLAYLFVPYIIFGIVWAFSIASGVLLVISGVKKGKISVCNLGMAVISFDIILLMINSELNFLGYGAVFLSLGAVFLTANKIMLKKMRPQTPAVPDKTEVSDNA